MPAPKNAPLYQQIYDEIKDAIEKGVYTPKERIPSELELAKQYEVSRITVRRAVEELCSDGYLVKQQGWRMYFTNSLAAENTERFTITTTGLCQRMPLAGLSVCFSKLEKSSWPFPVLWRI